jgi:glutamate racemase
MKLGVFDSGIGGEAVARSLQESFPDAEMVLADDRDHLPYGDRTQEDIARLTDAAIQPLLAARCDVIVIACNSATAAAIETLRARYPGQLFIGLEPMLKPAALQTKTGIIAVCATPATLSSDRYLSLKKTYTDQVRVLEPDCSEWARIIEDNDVNEAKIERTIETLCDEGADVIVLACTHYHWISEVIERTARGRAVVLLPSEAIARRVSQLLESR